MKLKKRYTFIGRLISGLQTYQEEIWVDGTKFTKEERRKRAYLNFCDIPTCMCNSNICDCSIHEGKK